MRHPIASCGSHRGPKVNIKLPPHYNEGLELVTIRKGSTQWQVENQVYSVQAGDLFFTLPWERHGGLSLQEPGLEIDWIDIRVGKKKGHLRPPPGLDMPPAVWETATSTFLHATVRCVPGTSDLHRSLARIVEWHHNPSSVNRTRIMHLLPLLLLDAVDCVALGRLEPFHAKDRSTLRVLQLLSRLQTNPTEPAELDSMAAECGLGRSRFADLVKHHTGDSPIQYVNRLRIENACSLLLHSDKSITEIAFETGFESSQYFARTFKSFQSCTPTAYRLQEK